MTWLQKFRLREYLRESLWIIPLLFVAGAVLAAMVLEEIDRVFTITLFPFTPGAAQSVLGAIAGSMITFTGFVFSTVMVALQFASGQISPRVLKSAFRDPRSKIALGTFVFTFTYALLALADIDDTVPQLTVLVGILAVLASVVVFLLMLNALSRDMRAANMVHSLGASTRAIVDEMYPDPARPDEDGRLDTTVTAGMPSTVVVNSGRPGVLMAYDREGLVEIAHQHDAIVELLPDTGDFVPTGSPLFRVFGTASIDPAELLQRVAFGAERSIEQDPAFGFRILVDAAAKALSPGVNDPTTAVVAIDQIHDLLQLVGSRRLRSPGAKDATGAVRLIDRHATWADYVSLACDEIRQFGAGSVQVARRLRAMLLDVMAAVPPCRTEPLIEQLNLLDNVVERSFADAVDQHRARIADHKGLGSSERTLADEPKTPAPGMREPLAATQREG